MKTPRHCRALLVAGLGLAVVASGCRGVRVAKMGEPPARSPVVAAEEEALLASLRRWARPVQLKEPAGGHEDLQPVTAAIGEAGLVGLGEASHGTREFFHLRRRLVQRLVTEHGFRVLALEGHHSYVSVLDHFVKTGEWLQFSGHQDGIFASREFFALLRWMRDYNRRVPPDRQLSLTAIDCQYVDEEARRIAAHLALVAPREAERATADLAPLLEPFTYHAAGAERQQACRTGIERILGLLAAHRDALVARTSARAHGQVLHFARTMRATEKMWRQGETEAGLLAMYNVRDRAMADNVAFVRQGLFPEQKVVLLAHNGHIARGYHQALGLHNLGEHLAERYGEDYHPLGFSFHHGAIRASSPQGQAAPFEPTHVPPAAADSVESQFQRLGLPAFWLDLRRAGADPALGPWLSARRRHRSIGAVYQAADDADYYQEVLLPRAFDSLIFVAESHASQY